MTNKEYDLSADGEATNLTRTPNTNPNEEGITMSNQPVSIRAPEAQDVQHQADPMVAMIERVAMDPNLPIERLEALMDMRERQMNKEAEQVFNKAFAAAMGEMGDVPRTGKNDHTQKKYSTLDDLIRKVRPVLARHGLSLNWQTGIDGNNITATAIVRHAQGHSINTTLTGPRDNGKQMNALQGGGSTETYLKRYSGFSILGLSSGDETEDDGRAANSATVSADQYVQLRDKAEQAGVDEAKICLAAGVSDLHQFPANHFDAAIKRLDRNMGAKKDA